MHWLVFATLSILSISIANLFQKLAMKEEKSDPVASAIIFQMVCTVLTGAFAVMKGFLLPPPDIIFPYLVISAVCYGLGSILFFKAIKIIEASEMAILTGFGAIATIASAYLFLSERLTALQLVGVASILLSLFIVNYERKKLVWNKGVLFSLLGTSLFGLAVTNDAFILKSYDAISYTPIAFFLPGVLQCVLYPKKAFLAVASIKSSLNVPLLIFSFLYGIQAITYYLALTSGALASQMNAFFKTEIVLTIILASLYLKETKRLPQKVIAAALTTLGVILIA